MTKKVVRIGTIKDYNNREQSIFCEIEFASGKLSITGVVGPRSNGNAAGGCGQIIMEFKEYDHRGYSSILDITPAPLWTHAMIKKFFDIWDKWHLNDMQAGCKHQRDLGWNTELIDPDKPPYQDNMKMWLSVEKGGYLSAPCPVCGYKYGTAWLKEDVPHNVINWLFALPDTDKTPAWV
jgi:hypothetical protein